jgi:hypothetical protein
MIAKRLLFAISIFVMLGLKPQEPWNSKFVLQNADGSLTYTPDAQGNTLPDFSRVGYQQNDVDLPQIPVVVTLTPACCQDNGRAIQSAIDQLSQSAPDKNGWRGTILLTKGSYHLLETLTIHASGIVLRGEGEETKLVAEGVTKYDLIQVAGTGRIIKVGTTINVVEDNVPVGALSFEVDNTHGFATGDSIIIYRPGTDAWIEDLKMNAISGSNNPTQWQAKDYNFQFERVITKIENNRIYFDNPIVMPLEKKYGGAQVYKYAFKGRLRQIGIENLVCESRYKSDEDENHGWNAITLDKIQDGWVSHVTAMHFGLSCVYIMRGARNITVDHCSFISPKSVISGARRYSFNVEGQLNLVMNCSADSGRHDYVTGPRVCGPNVFYNCYSTHQLGDSGPHQRWAMGTLYDNLQTDGKIDVEDRGNLGSGHGWAGTTQVIWNCTAQSAIVQSPWVSGKNYCIGFQGQQGVPYLQDRPMGEWEGQHQPDLRPQSLYKAQWHARRDTPLPVTPTEPKPDHPTPETPQPIPTPLENDGNNRAISIYPNPTKVSMHVDIEETAGDTEIRIIDALGRTKKTFQANGRSADISIENFLPGVYWVIIKNKKIHTVKKVVIE